MKKNRSKLINLPGYVIKKEYFDRYRLKFWLKSRQKHSFCLDCKAKTRTYYETRERKVKHSFWDHRPCFLFIEQRLFRCKKCKKRFWEKLPGVQKYARRTEAFKKQIAKDALSGYNNKSVSYKFNIAESTVQRDINHHTNLELRKISGNICPRILGIDEHFFTKKKGYVTTFCDLQRKRIFDISLGRSQKALESYLRRLKHKERAEIVVMDLSSTYRSIVKKYFPKAKIITDRFHVIRLVNQRFNETWKILDEKGRNTRSLCSLFRRKAAKLSEKQEEKLHDYLQTKHWLSDLYRFKNQVCKLLTKKSIYPHQAKKVIRSFLNMIQRLKDSAFKPLISLAETLEAWSEEILRMMKHDRSNGPTEGFHNKMKRIVRIGYGFRNFRNYRNRVLLQCG